MKNTILTQAIEDLTFAVVEITKHIPITFKIEDTTTNSHTEMVEDYNKTKVLTVSRDGCDTSIYGNAYINILARVWHDHIHLTRHKSFNTEDELFVAKLQRGKVYNTLAQAGISADRCEAAARLIFIDIYDQVKYYEEHKQFVPDQKKFVSDIFLKQTV